MSCCCCSCYFCCLHSVCVCVCVAFCIFWLWGNSATIYANCAPIAEIALSQFQLSHRSVCISLVLYLSLVSCVYVCVCALRSLTLSWLKLFIVYFVANEFSYLLPQFDLFSMFSWPPLCVLLLSCSLSLFVVFISCENKLKIRWPKLLLLLLLLYILGSFVFIKCEISLTGVFVSSAYLLIKQTKTAPAYNKIWKY